MKKFLIYKQYDPADYGPPYLQMLQHRSCCILIVIILVISGSCTRQHQPDNMPEYVRYLENLTIYSASDEQVFEIDVEREQKFRDTTEVIIGRISAFAVDENGRVYIADADQLDIKAFTPDGRFITQLVT